MASIINFSINLDKIPKDKIIQGKTGKFLPMTVTINDELDQYGNPGPVIVAQSKEERESKKDKVYLGNAKVIWTNGINVEKTPWIDKDNPGDLKAPAPQMLANDDLPF